MCPSQIDPTLPVFATPTTQSVRNNFQIARDEITTLQQQTNGSPFLPLAGGRLTGAIYLANDPTDAMMPATKGYVDASGGGGGGGGIPEAPADGLTYGRDSGAWHQVLPIEGGTLIGPLILVGAATDPFGAVTKMQLDAIVSSILPDAPSDGNAYGRKSQAWAQVLPIAGGVLTGNLGLNVAIPTTPAPAAAQAFALAFNATQSLSINAYQSQSGASPQWNYLASGFAGFINLNQAIGALSLGVAPSGTAGAAASANRGLTLDVMGNLALYGIPSAMPLDGSSAALYTVRSAIAIGGTQTYNSYYSTAAAFKVLATGFSATTYLENGAGTFNLMLYGTASAGAQLGAPAAQFNFNQNGMLYASSGFSANNGRVISRNAGGNPSVSVYDTSANYSCGIWTSTYNFFLGVMDGNGGPISSLLRFDGAGNLFCAGGILQINGTQNFQLYADGSGNKTIAFNPGYFLQWAVGTGSLSFTLNNSEFWIMRNDWLCFNNVGPVAGYGAYENLSDIRSKTDIEPTTKGIDVIRALVPVEFTRQFPSRRPPSPNREIGFVAQHVSPVLPEAVVVAGMTLPDGGGGLDSDEPSLAIASDMILAVAVNAIKQLDARLRTLENTA